MQLTKEIYMRKHPLLVCIIFCIILALPVASQTPQNLLTLHSIENSTLQNSPDYMWRYNLGDTSDWATPQFDDSHWPQIPNSLITSYKEVFSNQKIGWFRLSITPDSSIIGVPLYLAIYQTCAVQVYINGSLHLENGTPSGDVEIEECICNWETPLTKPFIFTKDSTYSIAVRYSYHAGLLNSRELHPKGFHLHFITPSTKTRLSADHSSIIIRWFFTGIPLTFSFLYFFLYLYNKRERAHGIYSLLTFATAGITFNIMGSVDNIPLGETDIRLIGFKVSLMLVFISGTQFLYSIFKTPLPKYFKIYRLILFILLPFVWLTSIPELYFFGFLALIEQARIIVMANIKKFDGARIIGAGFLLSIIGDSLTMTYGLGFFEHCGYIAQHAYIYGNICVLTCMSIYLARDFAKKEQDLSNLFGKQEDTIQQLQFEMKERKKAQELTAKQQQELIQADKMATLGILVSGVAHEINNPNTYILMNSNNLTDIWKDLTPHLNKYVEHNGEFLLGGMPYSEVKSEIPPLISSIADGSERIRKIVENLKDFGRVDPGNFDQNVKICSVIEASTLILANMLKKSTNNFSIHCPDTTLEVAGNFQQIEQVIINLLSNACQALEDKNQSITITVTASKKSVTICIEDTGKGISKEDMSHIMDPFFTTNRDNGGTGLGLSISYNIIRDHHGELHYDSEKGVGTKALLTLPQGRV